jgi:hexosaminidase
MRVHVRLAVVALITMGLLDAARANDAAALRLVPFPKQVELQSGTFSLDQPLVLQAPAKLADRLGRLIGDEFRRAGLTPPKVQTVGDDVKHWTLAATPAAASEPKVRDGVTPQDYALGVRSDGVSCSAPGDAGLLYGVQTLCQLIRANRRGQSLPCLEIRDWPSLAWRGFQDDMTRGPSAKLDTLKREVDLGAGLKMNLFTYYMEHQYAFPKNPVIGPKDGSLLPDELKALVAYAKPREVEILGNQQSFGHFGAILAHPQYAALRETPEILTPVKEETYQLIDSLYSDVVPLLPFGWFNVCCDETQGLGTGPSKELAAKIGPGGVYVQHIRRLHDLLKEKYGKRMMMWGDIILLHPDKLDQIPKDTIMLTWAYDPRANFDAQITPFAKSGYEFFVCPGINDWCRVLPDFGASVVNIQNFVRDGVKHHALGMLNTEWKDDAVTLRAPAWHGYAWGAECAWNGSTTSPKDFNRRIGAVLFGEKGDHFGQAIELIDKAQKLPVAKLEANPSWLTGITNSRFCYEDDFLPKKGEAATRALAEPLLALIRPAIEHLNACRKDATVNADLLDAHLLGARRIELIGQRMLDGVEAAKLYTAATTSDQQTKLAAVEQLVRRNRDAHEAVGKEFASIWSVESKPHALDWAMGQFRTVVQRYDALASKLAGARRQAEAGKPLPKPSELGLALPADSQ